MIDRRRDWHGIALSVWRDSDRVMLSLALTGCREAGRAVRMELPKSIIDRVAEDAEIDVVTIDVSHDDPTNWATLEHTLEDLTRGCPNVRYRVLRHRKTSPSWTPVRFWGPSDEIEMVWENTH